jgi:hypothetical protein
MLFTVVKTLGEEFSWRSCLTPTFGIDGCFGRGIGDGVICLCVWSSRSQAWMSLPRSKHKRNGGGRKKGNQRRKDKKPTGQEPDRVQCPGYQEGC